MKRINILPVFALVLSLAFSCKSASVGGRTDVIFDTDANNELDDQHAIAYMLMNQEHFNVIGITTNNTHNGDGIQGQTREARRIIDLCGEYGRDIVLKSGADANFEDIREHVGEAGFDGSEAVDFIIAKAKEYTPESKLTLIAVGKLTNVALAYLKAPEIIPNVRLVWLGGNYPEPGEYNLVDDIPSMNYILDTDADFEMVTVRYRRPDGTDAVRITKDDAQRLFAGKGPHVDNPVVGRHGGEFHCFGDYSSDLFEHIRLHSDGSGTRSLYDLCAVAVVKNPAWGKTVVIPAPTMVEGEWVERPENARSIVIWENFDRDGIINDFIATLDRCTK